MSDDRIHGPIGDAYAAYDSDPRANGPDGFEAFADAVEPLVGKTVHTQNTVHIEIDEGQIARIADRLRDHMLKPEYGTRNAYAAPPMTYVSPNNVENTE